MAQQTPDRRRTRPQPSRPRVSSWFAVLLFCFASVAQAAHIHGDWLPHARPAVSQAADASLAPSEADCPLCMAMHATVATFAISVTAPALLTTSVPRAIAVPVLTTHWHFDLFSRPPPHSV